MSVDSSLPPVSGASMTRNPFPGLLGVFAPPKPAPLNEADQSDELPRQELTLAQAASALGKSISSLERSLAGRWGNKLPEGWTARKLPEDEGAAWRLMPPPSFRVRQTTAPESNQPSASASFSTAPPQLTRRQTSPRRLPWRPDSYSAERQTIIIDRSEEVEHLLRELLTNQKALSKERRQRMEDMRLIAQLQGSMRLLESSASDSARIKSELESTRKEMEQLKRDYNYVVNLPWWKRFIASFTK